MSEQLGREFREISPNPYIVGTPVRDSAMFFGREREFEFVRQRFHGSKRGLLLVFYGERRSGKTSILFQIEDGRLGEDFVPVLIDMQSMAVRDESEFLGKIAAAILRRVHAHHVAPPDFQAGGKPSDAFRAFLMRVLAACPDKKPILMFDEYELFENKIDNGILTEDLLHMFSHVMQNYALFLIFTGSQLLEERGKHYWHILGAAQARSVSFLQPEDAMRLIRVPVTGLVTYSEGTDESIHRLAAGQPLYTQAICQRLVDHLNEARTHRATQDILERVVTDVVNNPYPQMLWVWDARERDEKLTLALLAERLEGENNTASAKEIAALLKERYPTRWRQISGGTTEEVSLSESDISRALENLVTKDLLNRSDALPGRYAFRMDIWRRWVRAVHSTWQVLRELSIRPVPPNHRRLRMWLIGSVVLVAGLMGFRMAFSPKLPIATLPGANFTLVRVDIPEDAWIYKDGSIQGARGQDFEQNLQTDTLHVFRVDAVGYADTTFAITPVLGRPEDHLITLSPVYGFLSVTTQPSQAGVQIDGEPIHKGAILQKQAERTYAIRALLHGYDDATASVSIVAGSDTALQLVLMKTLIPVNLTANPSMASIFLGDSLLGQGRATTRLTQGQHSFRASLDGYITVDSLVMITKDMLLPVTFTLPEEPPGTILVKGSVEAEEIYLDGQLRKGRTTYFAMEDLRPGKYEVKVILQGRRDPLIRVLTVDSGYKTVFDFEKDEIRRVPIGET